MSIEINPIYYYSIDHKMGKADKRRLSIIQAAIKSMASEGYEGVNFERLSRKMKIRRSHIVYYFKDRNELVVAMVRYVVALAQELTVQHLSKKKTIEDKIHGICEATFLWADEYREHIQILVTFYALCGSQSTFRKLNTELKEVGSARIAELLKMYDSKDSAVHIRNKARSIQSTIAGHVIEYIGSNSDLNFQMICLRSIDAILAS
tara:strand:- start:31792 stop:32409 length:618 start_codon:yes stop_codon:yes gene_type:complete